MENVLETTGIASSILILTETIAILMKKTASNDLARILHLWLIINFVNNTEFFRKLKASRLKMLYYLSRTTIYQLCIKVSVA